MRPPKSLAPIFTAARFHTYTFPTVDLNHKINECVSSGNVSGARKLFDDYPHSRNAVSWNSLINGCIKAGHFTEAQKLFDDMPHRDVVSWNTLLSGFRDAQSPEKARHHFLRMIKHKIGHFLEL